MEDCKHEEFVFLSKVGRLTDVEGGEVTSWTLDCKIQCKQCKMFFEFVGVPTGFNYEHPTTSADFTELRMPIRPFTDSMAAKVNYQFERPKNKEIPN